jgi:acetylornithine deacetylase/succinyl-diaminopimelate desuccinylase-like protein
MIDVVPVDPTTVDQWTHPPYSGYFDGEFLLYPGAMDTHYLRQAYLGTWKLGR